MDIVSAICITGIVVAAIAAILVIFYASDQPLFGGRETDEVAPSEQACALVKAVGSVKRSGRFESHAVRLISVLMEQKNRYSSHT